MYFFKKIKFQVPHNYILNNWCCFLFEIQPSGTGSGLGTFLLKVLEDEFPEVYRFVTSIYPSGEDDVITSPYNSILAMKELNEHADCVLPIDNQVRSDTVIYGRMYIHSCLCYACVFIWNILHFSAFPSKKKISLNPFTFSSFLPLSTLLNSFSPIFFF